MNPRLRMPSLPLQWRCMNNTELQTPKLRGQKNALVGTAASLKAMPESESVNQTNNL